MKQRKNQRKKQRKKTKKRSKFKLYEPTITKKIKGKHEKILEFLKNNFFVLYHKYTIPKRIKKMEKLRNIKDPKSKKHLKKSLMKGFRKELKKIIRKKKIKAILDLTLLDFLKIFLNYGYKDENGKMNEIKQIEINEKEYGFKTIKLDNFKTYFEIRDQFSTNTIEQEKYRKNLLNIITGK